MQNYWKRAEFCKFVKKAMYWKSGLLAMAFMFKISTGTAQEKVAVTDVIHVDVMPTYATAVQPLLTAYIKDTRKEKGLQTCKVYKEVGRPNHLTIVEEWESQADFDNHLATAETRLFKEKLHPMQGGPLDERLHTEVK
jgi:quinol monooxygenase YgiN